MTFKLFTIFLITLQISYLANALSFYDIKGKNLEFVFEPFTKFEGKCVFLSEFNTQLIGLSNQATILNYFHEKYSRYGLQVIGYFPKNKNIKKPSNIKFEIFIGLHSIRRLNDFLKQRGLELIHEEKFLVQKDGKTVYAFNINPKYKPPQGLLGEVFKKIPHMIKDKDEKAFRDIEKRITDCLGLEYD